MSIMDIQHGIALTNLDTLYELVGRAQRIESKIVNVEMQEVIIER